MSYMYMKYRVLHLKLKIIYSEMKNFKLFFVLVFKIAQCDTIFININF